LLPESLQGSQQREPTEYRSGAGFLQTPGQSIQQKTIATHN